MKMNEPELYVGRCNGKSLYGAEKMYERAIFEALNGKKPTDDFSCIEIKIPGEVLFGEHMDEFMGSIINDLKRHISDEIADILSTNDEYVMSLTPSRIDINPMDFTQKMRIQLKHKPLVRCKDCVYCKKSCNGKLKCDCPSFLHMIDRPDGYCHNGKKPNLADYLVHENDNVDVVRCKDCEWWTKQKDSAQGKCELLGTYPTGGWYCANGKRKGKSNE